MKKVLAIIITVILAISFVSCSLDNNVNSTTVTEIETTESEYDAKQIEIETTESELSEYDAKQIAIEKVTNASTYELSPSNQKYYRIDMINIGSTELEYKITEYYVFSVKGTYYGYNEYNEATRKTYFDAKVKVYNDGYAVIDYCHFS